MLACISILVFICTDRQMFVHLFQIVASPVILVGVKLGLLP
jgi:hypothetical protein